MSEIVAVVDYRIGCELRLETPGRYSMDAAIMILGFLEAEMGAEVKNTGWKQGFGLEVAAGLPIRLEALEAELAADGSEIVVRRVSGSRQAFDGLCASICDFTSRA